MGLADAMSVRAGWSNLGIRTLTTGSNRRRYLASRLRAGHAAPRRSYTLQTGEPAPARPRDAWLKRSIPAMMLLLIALAFAARLFMLGAGAADVERSTRASLTLVAELAGERLLDRPGLEDVEADSQLAADLLASVRIPDDARSYVLATSAGKLIAEAPSAAGAPDEVHAPVEARLATAALPRLIIALSGSSDGARVELPDGSVHLAAGHTVTVLPSGAALMLIVLRDEATLFADWMRDIAFELVMMAAVALSLFILLFAYLRQNARQVAEKGRHAETSERFNTALLRGRCGMWDWDLARGTMTWSPSMFEILGHEEHDDALCVRDVTDLVHPEDLDLVSMGNDALAGAGEAIDRRFRMRTADASWTWVRMRAEIVADSADNPHLIGIAVDVTEQEALERQSERADTRLRDGVESISEAFVLWDARRRLVLWNSKFQQFYALDNDVLVRGARHEDVQAASRQPLSRRRVNAMRETEAGASTEEVELDDGRWLQVNERRTKDGGVVSVQTDITQIKRNEEKLLQSERRLMATVSSLKETQLQLEIQAQHLHELAEMHKEASEKAEAGNRTKSEFMANISHELRTPLNAILGFSDIMTTEMFGPMGSGKYSEYAHDIHDSGMFLLGVINDVLDMSKIEAGRMQLDPETLDLTATVDETLRIIDVQANQKELVLKRSVPEHMEVEADRRAIKQIMLNLLSNAVKFTPCGGEIHVRIRRENGMVKMGIADTGCGINRDALRRIGVPFEQAQNAFTKDHKGSGLGLAIARSLAELHGGSLDVRSIVGKGTFVLVRIPERQTIDEPVVKPRPVAAPVAKTKPAEQALELA